MTAPAGLAILRRPGLGGADTAGLLPAAAAAGAQVRSMLAATMELPAMERPRAMVVVGADVDNDVAFLRALLGRTSPSPIVAAATLPPWVGALDLVVVLAARPDDDLAAEAAGIARRRGATTVVRGAEYGPVAEAAGPSLLPVAVAVPEALAASARWSLLAVVAARSGLGPPVELARTADLLDAIAVACHPAAENFVNPGVNLAEYLGTGTPLLIGCDAIGDAIARHGAHVLADVGGVASSVLTVAHAGSSPALLRRTAAGKDLFADPFSDDTDPAQSVKPLLVSTAAKDAADGRSAQAAADRRVLAGLIFSFPGAMHLDGSADSLPTVSGLPNWSAQDDPSSFGDVREAFSALPVRPADAFSPPPVGAVDAFSPVRARPADAFDAAVAATLRLDFAAVYVGIATGQLVPLDFPDGLGRAGGSRWAVRPAAAGSDLERRQGLSTWS